MSSKQNQVPKATAPVQLGRMIVQRTLAVLLALILIFFITIMSLSLGIYPTLVTEKMKVDALWVPVEKSLLERQKFLWETAAALPASVENTAQRAKLWEATQKVQRAEVRADFAPDVPEQFAFYRDAEQEFAALGQKILALPEVPDVARAKAAERETQLSGEEAKYDAAALNYNALIAERPKSIVATVFKFLPKGTFAVAKD